MSSHPLVVTAGPGLAERARREAHRLGLPLASRPGEGDLALVLDEGGWALIDPAPGAARPVQVDFARGPLGEALRRGVGRRDRLARALGIGRGERPRVLDATAGMGRDTMLAAALGCTVMACERSPVVALLLRDGLERAAAHPHLASLVERVTLVEADAREVIGALTEEQRPDVVLIDPMFPERTRTARAKKEMQALQRILGPDTDEDVTDLLARALVAARRRVAVKRPLHARPLRAAREPDVVIPGKASRFDVYLARS